MQAYAQSKQANRMWTRALARRLRGTKVTANSLHPGSVATGKTGGFYRDRVEKRCRFANEGEEEKLFARCEVMTGKM